jgi:hypothetical protein
MPAFTIETTYRLPVFRQHNYDAETVEQACALAIDDDDWSDAKQDYDSAGTTFISGIWEGRDAAYGDTRLAVPAHYDEGSGRKVMHFEVLLRILMIFTHAGGEKPPDLAHWLPKAQAAIAKGEAILAGEPDSEEDPGDAPVRSHILAKLEEGQVREQIAAIIDTDPIVTKLAADAIGVADIRAACMLVAAESDLSEEIGAAAFRAALAAIRNAEHRLASPA